MARGRCYGEIAMRTAQWPLADVLILNTLR
jgi:hypothetical protein